MTESIGIGELDRVLIAAAAVAALGERIRIVDIRPIGESKRNRWSARPQTHARPRPARKAAKREIADHG